MEQASVASRGALPPRVCEKEGSAGAETLHLKTKNAASRRLRAASLMAEGADTTSASCLPQPAKQAIVPGPLATAAQLTRPLPKGVRAVCCLPAQPRSHDLR